MREISAYDLIEQIRIQKDHDELVSINKAVEITDMTFKIIKSHKQFY